MNRDSQQNSSALYIWRFDRHDNTAAAASTPSSIGPLSSTEDVKRGNCALPEKRPTQPPLSLVLVVRTTYGLSATTGVCWRNHFVASSKDSSAGRNEVDWVLLLRVESPFFGRGGCEG